jgi:hypothetical protein
MKRLILFAVIIILIFILSASYVFYPANTIILQEKVVSLQGGLLAAKSYALQLRPDLLLAYYGFKFSDESAIMKKEPDEFYYIFIGYNTRQNIDYYQICIDKKKNTMQCDVSEDWDMSNAIYNFAETNDPIRDFDKEIFFQLLDRCTKSSRIKDLLDKEDVTLECFFEASRINGKYKKLKRDDINNSVWDVTIKDRKSKSTWFFCKINMDKMTVYDFYDPWEQGP